MKWNVGNITNDGNDGFPFPVAADTLGFRSTTDRPSVGPAPNVIKEYRLVSWPESPAEFQRTVHRRMLSALSQRFMSVPKLVECSGMRKADVRLFLDMLESRGVLTDRTVSAPESVFDSFKPLGGWLRRALSSPTDKRVQIRRHPR